MATPRLTKAWTVTPNLRVTYVSLAATMGWFAYENKTALIAAGWTMKFSSDGTTGPSSGADTTDRITSAATFVTRATVAAAAQSWFVVQNADGVQLMITYQGASDDICRISYSHGGLFTLAGTTTHQPTATDEMVLSTGNSVINATTANDRVMTIWCTTESWCNALFRQATMQAFMSVEKFDSAVLTSIQAKPYLCTRYTDLSSTINNNPTGPMSYVSNTAFGAAGWTGTATFHTFGGTNRASRVTSVWYPAGPAGSNHNAGTLPLTSTPALQGGGAMPLLPHLLQAESATNLNGFAGIPIDNWWALTSSFATPARGDFCPGLDNTDSIGDSPRTNWLIALGAGRIMPWRNAAASLITT
jgi:hypothetical protein